MRLYPLVLLYLLVGCGESDDSKSEDTGEPTDTGQGSNPDDTDDTGDTGVPVGASQVIVLAGGGTEGDQGDDSAWSAELYGALLETGDVTGDGQIQVAILSAEAESDWLPGYFQWLGADAAFNVTIDSVEAAEDTALTTTFESVDVVFIKGGDQGLYYDLWNDTLLESLILQVVQEREGAIGGTSAGAMSLAEFALAGGKDLISEDILKDSHSEYLDDESDGGSGVHDDFLGVIDGVIIDTHFTERARLGRLAGAQAKALDDLGEGILGVGIEQRTGLVIRAGQATVVGVGAVCFLQPTAASIRIRDEGSPLVWTDLRLDRLTAGWVFDLGAAEVDTTQPPATAEAVSWDGVTDTAEDGSWWVDGDRQELEERFEWAIERDPDPYGLHAGTDLPIMPETTGIVAAHDTEYRANNQESLFRALYDEVGVTGFLVGYGGTLERDSSTLTRIAFAYNPYGDGSETATIVVGTADVTYRSLSAEYSNYDIGASLQAAGLVGMRLHILADSEGRGLYYDVEQREVVQAR